MVSALEVGCVGSGFGMAWVGGVAGWLAFGMATGKHGPVVLGAWVASTARAWHTLAMFSAERRMHVCLDHEDEDIQSFGIGLMDGGILYHFFRWAQG